MVMRASCCTALIQSLRNIGSISAGFIPPADGAPANATPTIRDSWPGAALSVRVASVEEGGTDREEGERVATEEHRILERGQRSSE